MNTPYNSRYIKTAELMDQLLSAGWELRVHRCKPASFSWIAKRGTTTIISAKNETARSTCVRAAYYRVFNLDEVSA